MDNFRDSDKPQDTKAPVAPRARGTDQSMSNFRDTPPSRNKLLTGQADKENPNLWNVVYGLQGAYKEAAMNNIMVQPVRTVMQGLGIGMDDLKKQNPGQTEEWYKEKHHEMYNRAIRDARKIATKQVDDNPYFGDKVANFGAGMLGSADPTWLLPVPGVGGIANPVGRVGAQAVGHGAMSSAADAAGQGMDIASGTTDKFDVGRNLTNAAFGAAFGGSIQGLEEASPFIKQLFNKRGVDTTPGADPRAQTRAPTTGEEPVLTSEQNNELRNLIRTGSKEDIATFFADKQGPKPTWEDLDKLVEARDALPENAVRRYTEALDEHIESTHSNILRNHFDTQMADWKNKPEVEVIRTAEDIADPEIRANAIRDGLSAENTVGIFSPDGKIRVFADAVKTPEQASAVLFHEGLGHYGLQQTFGTGLDKQLDTLAARNVSQFGKAVDDWQKKNPGAYGGSRTRAAEEVLAEMSEKGAIPKSISDALVAHVRRFGRRMGMKLNYSDAEVRNILAMVHDFIKTGKRSEMTTTSGFRRMMTEDTEGAWLSANAADRPLPPKMDQGDMDYVARTDNEGSATWRPDNPKGMDDRDVEQALWEDDMANTANRPPPPRGMSADEQNRFMFTGQSAKDFDPNSPTKYEAQDGSVRNEISDKGVKVNLPDNIGHYDLQEVLDHPALFEQYPQLRKLSVSQVPLEGFDAMYYPASDMSQPRIEVNVYAPNKKQAILHEVQHAIQDIEQYPDFVKARDGGGSVAKADDVGAYNDIPAEREAILTENRAGLDEAGRVNDRNFAFMTPDQLAKHAKNVHETAFEKFGKGYTPRYRSIKEAQQAARDTALSPEAIKDSRAVGNLDRKLFVYDNAAKAANDRLMVLAKKAEAGPLDADDLVELAAATNEFHYVLGRLDNDLGQVGRALNAAKQMEFRRNNILAMKQALEDEGSPLGPLIDPDTADKFLKQFAALLGKGNPNGAAQMLKSVNKPYWWQYLLTYRNNMMLSGLSTHLKVTMDTATTAGREIEEKVAALPAGVLRDIARSMGLKNVQQGVHPAEVAGHLWGMSKAVLDAQTYKDAAQAFKGNQNQRFGGTGIQNPRIPLVSKVTDAIAFQDAFFRAVLTNANLYALGTRMARDAGFKSWDDITTAAAGYARNPTQKMMDEATDLAENAMLTNESQLNDAIDRAKRIKPGMNGLQQSGSFMVNYLTPFIRTQSNALMNQLVRRSPLSFLDPMTRADFKAGGARRDVAIMRTLIGTAIIWNAWNAAGEENKKLEGPGPVGKTDKLKELEASGWRPNSIHEDGRYNVNSNLNLSLNPFDLHNNTATLVAGVREAWDKGTKKDAGLGLQMAMYSALTTLQNQTFMSDIGEGLNVFAKPGEANMQKAQRWVGNQAASFIPNVIRQTSKQVDPIARDTSDGIKDQLLANIPVASKGLPARVSAYGEDVKGGQSILGVRTWWSEGNGQEEVTDPTHVELARLAKLIPQTVVSPVEKTISVPDTDMFEPRQITDAGNVKLTARQFEEYQRAAGQEIVERTREAMANESWDEMDDDERIAWVKKMVPKAKKAVREDLYGTNDDD